MSLQSSTRGCVTGRYAVGGRLRVFGTLALATLVLAISCSPRSRAPTNMDEGFVAVVGAGQDDPLWPALRGSALRQRISLGQIPIRAEAPPMVSSRAQAQLIRKLRAEGMRALCVQVIDSKAIAPQLERLANEGVVVVTMVHAVGGSAALMHSGVDQRLVGEALAEVIAEGLQNKGTIAVLHAGAKWEYAQERYDAFSARIKRYPLIRVLREFDCAGDPRRARDAVRRCMERFPRLNGWVALDNWPLRGLAADRPLLPPSCKLVTTGASPAVWDHLSAGGCFAMIATNPEQIARHAVLKCASTLERRVVRRRTYLAEPRPIWASNLHAYKLEWMEWCSHHDAGGT